jgi:hypothetical protein
MARNNLIYVGYSNNQAENVYGNMNQNILVKNTVFLLAKYNTGCGFRNNATSDSRIWAWICVGKDINPFRQGNIRILLKEHEEILWI